MKFSRESLVHKQSPEYRHALQELIKFELQALVERLSATGEEALVLTASCQDGSSMQFGSQKAEGFLRKQASLGQDFLTYCHDDKVASSADEMCNSGDEVEDSGRKESPVSQQSAGNHAYSPIRPRERTSSKRMSFSEKEQKDSMYEVSQNSDLSASERNDSASSVASFVEAHQKVEKSNKKGSVQCKICSRTFRSYKTLGQHLRLHMSKSYKCNICGKIFTLKKSYQRHIKSHKPHKDDKMFECGLCNKSFSDLNTWKRHRVCHLDVRKYSCNLCGKAFYEKYSLRVHQTSHFYPSLKLDKNSDITSGFSCHICGKSLKTKNAVKNHMLTHSAKKFTCEFCNKRFSQKYSYVRHRRIHTGEKPYKCGSCDRSFSDGSAWAKHAKTHTGVKPFSCNVCDRSFYDRTLCKTHIKTHEGWKGYKQADEDNKRNFKILATGLESRTPDESYKLNKEPSGQLTFDLEHATPGLFDDDLNLRLDVSDKESDDSQLLESGFVGDYLPAEDNKKYKVTDKSSEKKFTSIMDNFVLDEKFQSEFVERNMPIKPIESDNELISTAFPEDSDILADDTESELQQAGHTAVLFSAKSDTSMIHKQKQRQGWSDTSMIHEQKQRQSSQRKATQRRAARGKVFAESPAKCKICRKKFTQESQLKQHLQFHCMSKLYKCRYCGKQLSTQNSLIRHERIHMGDRPYQCNLCEKTFADNYGCIRHINAHYKSKGSSNNRSSKQVNDGQFAFQKQSNEQVKYPALDTELGPDQTKKYSPKKVTPTAANKKAEVNTYPNPASSTDSFKGTKLRVNVPCTAASFQSPQPSVSVPCTVAEQTVKYSPENKLSEASAKCVSGVSSSKINPEKKRRYKCFKCAQLFPSESLCIEHIQKTCCKTPLTALDLATAHTSVTSPNLGTTQASVSSTSAVTDGVQKPAKRLYQCNKCLLMFEDQVTCERHVSNECQKPKVDTECAVQSILHESFEDPELTDPSFDSLPRLPFPEITNDRGYLNITDDMLLMSNSPAVSSDISAQPSVLTSSASDTLTTTLTSPTTGPLSFMPYSQLANQTSAGISPVVKPSDNITTPDGQFVNRLKKPVANVGSSNFINGNQGDKIDRSVQERTCSICNKIFTTKHILKQHTLIHMDRKFGCKYCMKKFHNKYGLVRHERIHTGETPFSCPRCRKAFGDNSTFRKHTRICCSKK